MTDTVTTTEAPPDPPTLLGYVESCRDLPTLIERFKKIAPQVEFRSGLATAAACGIVERIDSIYKIYEGEARKSQLRQVMDDITGTYEALAELEGQLQENYLRGRRISRIRARDRYRKEEYEKFRTRAAAKGPYRG